MKRAEFTINGTGLQFDRDYGIDRRSGWTVLHGGCVHNQFIGFWRACWILCRVVFVCCPWGCENG